MTIAPVVPTEAKAASERWLFVVFVAAWLANAAFSLVGANHTLLGPYQFRETQTALSTYFFPPTGFRFDYATPLFGPPWSVPLEFPAYQASVAWFVHATGMNLDLAGRLISWLYFQLALPGVFLVLGSLGLQRRFRWIVLALLVTSPTYVFFSRSFLIESEAMCAGVWFLAALMRYVDQGRWSWLAVASLAGALGAASKVTTIVVFAVAGLLYALDAVRRRVADGRGHWAVTLRMLAAHAVPVAAGLWWLIYSSRVRSQNPNADFLNTAFGYWSFGDLGQRLSWAYWRQTTHFWMDGVITQAGFVVAVLGFARAARPQRRVMLGLFAAFMAGPLIFSNLYYVHDYYFYASGLFLIMAVGVAVAGFFEATGFPRWLPWVLAALLPLLQLVAYGQTYLLRQQEKHEPNEVVRMIRDLTGPDDIVVIAGVDWDAAIPYYAGRRAFMFRAGSERDPAAVKAGLAQIDPHTVGAFVVFGRMELDQTWLKMIEHLDLDPNAVMVSSNLRVGAWFPRERVAEVRAKVPPQGYPTLTPAAPRPTADGQVVMGKREIDQRPEFAIFQPRPVGARITAGIAITNIGDLQALNAHAPSQLTFRLASNERTLVLRFGLADGAYIGPTRSDGVEFQVVFHPPTGGDRVLFSRMLNPAATKADQGTQRAEVALPADASGGEVVVRTLPGPAGNASYDWSYLGNIEVR